MRGSVDQHLPSMWRPGLTPRRGKKERKIERKSWELIIRNMDWLLFAEQLVSGHFASHQPCTGGQLTPFCSGENPGVEEAATWITDSSPASQHGLTSWSLCPKQYLACSRFSANVCWGSTALQPRTGARARVLVFPISADSSPILPAAQC